MHALTREAKILHKWWRTVLTREGKRNDGGLNYLQHKTGEGISAEISLVGAPTPPERPKPPPQRWAPASLPAPAAMAAGPRRAPSAPGRPLEAGPEEGQRRRGRGRGSPAGEGPWPPLSARLGARRGGPGRGRHVAAAAPARRHRQAAPRWEGGGEPR